MSLSQPIRTFLLAALLISAALFVRHWFERDTSVNLTEDDFPPPPVRVARDRQPTIVESEENWLEAVPRDATDESDVVIGAPIVLDLPPSPNATARPDTRRGPIHR